MGGTWIYLAAIGVIFALLLFFLFKFILGPRKADALAKLMETGQYKKAAAEAQAMVKKNERNHLAHYILALCYYNTKQYSPALYELRLLTRLNRFDDSVKEEDVRNKLAEIYLSLGQLEEAQKEFLLIIRLNPANYEIMFKIAKIFFERNFLEQAYSYFMKVIGVNAKHAEANFYIGQILYQGKKGNDAVVFLNNALKFDPQLHKANYFLGMINKNNSVYNQAITCFEDAQKDTEFRQRSRLMKGQCLFELGDFPNALIDLERAAKDITEEDSIALAVRYSLAAVYERLRDLPAAITQWEIIAKVKPAYNDVLEKLSTYQELRTDDKLKDFMTASNTGFEDMCRVTVKAMGFDIVKFTADGGNHAVILASEPESKWRNTKVSNKLIHIFRDTDTISEQIVRNIQEEMKKVNANKAICISTNKFSQGARDFAAARPIDLVDKSGLADILKKA